MFTIVNYQRWTAKNKIYIFIYILLRENGERDLNTPGEFIVVVATAAAGLTCVCVCQ